MSNADWATKDFYATLGVAKDASAADVKKAYRKLAREHHPDSKPDDAKAEDRFKAAAEAYHVLGDAERRAEYDQLRALVSSGGFPGRGGPRAGGAGHPGSGGGQPFDLDDLVGQGGGIGDLFGDLFGGGGGGGGGQRRTRRTPQRGSDVETTATISFLDALEGTTISLRLTSDVPCATCQGTGGKPGTQPRVCPVCDGVGTVTTAAGAFSMNETCRGCGGRQLVYDDPCPTCRGSGRGSDTRSVSARIPAGVKPDQRIRLRGKGSPGAQGGPAGDLMIKVRVQPHPVFERSGDNVTVEVPVTFDEAALGASVKVPTPGGAPVTVKVAPGTASGRRLRVRGKGAPGRDGSRGDLLVTVRIDVPGSLSEEARAAVEAYRTATAGAPDPRAEVLSAGAR